MESTLSLYKIFYTVANTQNISRASRELYISQPAISKAIQKLEQSLGVTLFYRNSRGVTLTHEGTVLYTHVQNAFQSISLGEEAVRREATGDSGTLHIGVSTTLCKSLLLPYLKEFIREHPSIRISITCQSSARTMEMLKKNQLDLGLIGPPASGSSLLFFSVGSIHDIFVATEDYRRNLHLPADADTAQIFHTATIMLLDQENYTRKYINEYMEQNHIEAPNFLEVSDMDLLIEFSRISMGIGCVIKEVVQDDLKSGRLLELPLDIPIHTRPVGFACQEAAAAQGPLARFLEFFQKQTAN